MINASAPIRVKLAQVEHISEPCVTLYLQIFNIPPCFVVVLQEVLESQNYRHLLNQSMLCYHTSIVHELIEQPTFSRSWYFMILWTGLMSRSLSCSLWPSRCLSSCPQRPKHKRVFFAAVRQNWLHRTHLEVSVYELRDDVLGLGFVLTVDHVHVETAFL